MTHKGSRIDGSEYFDDVLENGGTNGQAGILDGHGIGDYDNVRQKLDKEGLNVSVNCRFCNRRRGIVVEWPEIAIISANRPNLPPIAPKGWMYSPNNGTIYLQAKCPSCSNTGLAVHITPDEARKHMKTGQETGVIAQHEIQRWGADIAQMRRQQGIPV